MGFIEKHKKAIDAIQWLLIGLLAALCIVVFMGNRSIKRERDIARAETYIKIYESQSLEQLKKTNKELYDSIQQLNDRKPESAVQIRYKYTFKTDTITKTQFETKYVTVKDWDGKETITDSIYHYTKDNDTIKTNIDIKAKDVDWVTVDATIHDKFTIINRVGQNGLIETTINHSPNTEIEGVDAWHVKKSWKDKIFVGPSVGVMYDPLHNKVGPYIGISVGYNLLK